MSGIIDKYLGKWASRKLMVFIVASFGLFLGNLQSSDWTILATAYVSMVGFTEIVERIKKAN